MLYTNEKNIEVQIKYGVLTYKKYFGRSPRGIWLAECGYVQEVEKYLKNAVINLISANKSSPKQIKNDVVYFFLFKYNMNVKDRNDIKLSINCIGIGK